MINLPQHVSGITHPIVASMYLKKEYGHGHHQEDVLVIETKSKHKDADDHELFDSYLIDLLTDLEDLKSQAEARVGKFDRIDIRTYGHAA